MRTSGGPIVSLFYSLFQVFWRHAYIRRSHCLVVLLSVPGVLETCALQEVLSSRCSTLCSRCFGDMCTSGGPIVSLFYSLFQVFWRHAHFRRSYCLVVLLSVPGVLETCVHQEVLLSRCSTLCSRCFGDMRTSGGPIVSLFYSLFQVFWRHAHFRRSYRLVVLLSVPGVLETCVHQEVLLSRCSTLCSRCFGDMRTSGGPIVLLFYSLFQVFWRHAYIRRSYCLVVLLSVPGVLETCTLQEVLSSRCSTLCSRCFGDMRTSGGPIVSLFYSLFQVFWRHVYIRRSHCLVVLLSVPGVLETCTLQEVLLSRCSTLCSRCFGDMRTSGGPIVSLFYSLFQVFWRHAYIRRSYCLVVLLSVPGVLETCTLQEVLSSRCSTLCSRCFGDMRTSGGPIVSLFYSLFQVFWRHAYIRRSYCLVVLLSVPGVLETCTLQEVLSSRCSTLCSRCFGDMCTSGGPIFSLFSLFQVFWRHAYIRRSYCLIVLLSVPGVLETCALQEVLLSRCSTLCSMCFGDMRTSGGPIVSLFYSLFPIITAVIITVCYIGIWITIKVSQL